MKKEFPKKEAVNKEPPAAKGLDFKPKISGLSDKSFGVIKFILGVCLLPFVYSITAAFLNEFGVIDPSLQHKFWGGVVTLLVVYLFIWEPASVYSKGHELLAIVFSFVRPLVNVAPYLIPIYTLVLFIAYLILSLVITSPKLTGYFIFLFGLSIGLHLIFGAKSLRHKKEDFLKANYILVFLLSIFSTLFLLHFA